MSSRFVAAGTEQDPVPADDEWTKAKQEVESVRTSQLESKIRQEDGKSLYEVLQANKAAKQEAFEEAAKLTNQFRTLDDSEVAFLESVHENERRKDVAVRQETAEQLEAFRKQRAAADQAALQAAQEQGTTLVNPVVVTTGSWISSKKRRRTDKVEEVMPTVKQRKTSTQAADDVALKPASISTQTKIMKRPDDGLSTYVLHSNRDLLDSPKTTTTTSGLGLGAYASDDDDDDDD